MSHTCGDGVWTVLGTQVRGAHGRGAPPIGRTCGLTVARGVRVRPTRGRRVWDGVRFVWRAARRAQTSGGTRRRRGCVTRAAGARRACTRGRATGRCMDGCACSLAARWSARSGGAVVRWCVWRAARLAALRARRDCGRRLWTVGARRAHGVHRWPLFTVVKQPILMVLCAIKRVVRQARAEWADMRADARVDGRLAQRLRVATWLRRVLGCPHGQLLPGGAAKRNGTRQTHKRTHSAPSV